LENGSDEAARIQKEAEGLAAEEIAALVEALASKDDEVRYPAFLVLGERSLQKNDVYPYWEIFREKLKSGNAFQRSIGLTMCARNAKWDAEGKLDGMLDGYLACLEDGKPVVVRLCIQNLQWIVPYKKELCGKIAKTLMGVSIGSQKESQQKLVLLDILRILKMIRNVRPDPAIDDYFEAARGSTLLGRKERKELFEN
jgi:hypothetical protein